MIGIPFDRIRFLSILFYLVLFPPILGHNTVLSLLYCGRVDNQGGLWVNPAYIVLNWGIVDTYHPLSLHLSLDCLEVGYSGYSRCHMKMP